MNEAPRTQHRRRDARIETPSRSPTRTRKANELRARESDDESGEKQLHHERIDTMSDDDTDDHPKPDEGEDTPYEQCSIDVT